METAMMKKHIVSMITLAIFLSLLSTAAVNNRVEAKEPVSRIIDTFYKDNGLAGLSVAIRRHEGPIETYVRGYGNLETKDKTTKDTVYRIASVSKIPTTLAVLKLKDGGKLSFDESLSKYIPSFPYGEKITIRDLLQHTSGIPNFAALDAFSSNQAKEWKPKELLDILRDHLSTHPLEFEPGSNAAYSNSNFMILAIIAETASGMPFHDYFNKYVAQPLGMKNTAAGNDKEIVAHRAAGYFREDGKLFNAPFVSIVAPFGTGDFMSQPKDLINVTKAFKPGRLLTKATIEEMMQPALLNNGKRWISHSEEGDFSFGYCWELAKPQGRTEWIYTKSGAISGFFAYVLYFKSADVSIAISSNSQGNFSLFTLGLKIGEALGAVR
jgi:CubicO group peptidase (beta-lactamase class C family)